METLTDIFSHVCGQNDCLSAGGALLPVCRRCLGLYVGAAGTGLWLAVSGIWRRGLPSWSVFLLHEVLILAAMLAGLHVWGQSATWKLACGLWTGHVVILWLVGGTGHLWRRSRRPPRPQVPWRRRDKLQGLLMPVLLAGAAALIPRAMALGAGVWTAAVVAGAILLLAGTAAAGAALTVYLVARVRPGAAGPRGHASAAPRAPSACRPAE